MKKTNPHQILSNFEQELHGKKYVYYDNKDSNRLLVLFRSCMIAEKEIGKYEFLVQIYNDLINKNLDYNVLFLNDINRSYYQQDREIYQEILKTTLSLFKNQDVYYFGDSAGGSAALHFGILHNVSILAVDPQINVELTKACAENFNIQGKGLKALECYQTMKQFDFPDLDTQLKTSYYQRKILIISSSHPVDRKGAEQLQRVAPEKVMIKKHKSPYHSKDTRPRLAVQLYDMLNELRTSCPHCIETAVCCPPHNID